MLWQQIFDLIVNRMAQYKVKPSNTPDQYLRRQRMLDEQKKYSTVANFRNFLWNDHVHVPVVCSKSHVWAFNYKTWSSLTDGHHHHHHHHQALIPKMVNKSCNICVSSPKKAWLVLKLDHCMYTYVMVQFYLWFKFSLNQFNFDFSLPHTHYHDLKQVKLVWKN